MRFATRALALLTLVWPMLASGHLVKLHVRHELTGRRQEALLELFEAYNRRPGHGAVIRIGAGDDEIVDVAVIEAEAVEPATVLPLDEWLDSETRAGFVPGALATVTRDGLVLGLPLTADGSLAAFVAVDTDDPHEAFDLVRYLAGPEAGRIVARLTGLRPAHRAVNMFPERPRSADDLRVMSFNIRYGTADDGPDAWPERAPLVADVIRQFGPDLLGTQECLGFQRDELVAALPAFDVVAVGRDDGADSGEMCACFFRRDRFELRDHGTFWLSETPATVASVGWDAALCRIATWLRLRDRQTGQDVLWLNAHLDHRGPESRRRSALLIHRWLRDHHDRRTAIVVTGDFNALPSDAPDAPHYLLRHGDRARPWLVDTWTARHGGLGDDDDFGTYHGFTGRAGSGRIDWILTDEAAVVIEATIDRTGAGGRWPSDHFPVTAVIGIR